MVGQYLPQTNETCYSALQCFSDATVFFSVELNTAMVRSCCGGVENGATFDLTMHSSARCRAKGFFGGRGTGELGSVHRSKKRFCGLASCSCTDGADTNCSSVASSRWPCPCVHMHTYLPRAAKQSSRTRGTPHHEHRRTEDQRSTDYCALVQAILFQCACRMAPGSAPTCL